MSKRSPDQTFALTPPHSKHARKESPSPSAQDIQTLPPTQMISEGVLQRFHESLREWFILEPEEEGISRVLQAVVGLDQFLQNVQKQKQFAEILKRAENSPMDREAVEAVIFHDAFWKNISVPMESEPPLEAAPLASQHEAVVASWNAKFVNQSPLQSLMKHIGSQLANNGLYARYCSILQSSGMGKSRLLDELSKHHFMIPINLRQATTGFPPPDIAVREFFTEEVDDASSRVGNFLRALFEITTETIARMDKNQNITTRIIKFRESMSKGQSMESAGGDRIAFYGAVVKRARELSQSKPSDKQVLMEALNKLRTVLCANSGPEELKQHRIYVKESKQPKAACVKDSEEIFVDIFIAFDEAQTLVTTIDKEGGSRFIVLRRVLSSISSCPLYSFFLSTTGRTTQFAHPREQDPSTRISGGLLSTPRPFIYLGFDQLMQSRKVFQRWNTLKDVTSLECAAHMGRPLWGTRYDHGDSTVRRTLLDFAQDKLLCADSSERQGLTDAQIYAVLSQRLALDTNTTNYLFHSLNPLHALKSMREQISHHMRVCVAIEDGIETLRGVAPSEPILSEAASRIMLTDKFSLLSALSLVLSGYCINRGDRGELVVASFFTWARDQVVKSIPLIQLQGRLCPYFSVTELFQHLFTELEYNMMLDSEPSLHHPDDPPQSFGTVFRNAVMHFNHFVKPQEQGVLARPYLLHFIARGAAALGANCQPGLDAVYPFLYGTTGLDIDKVGFIIVQVKNRSTKSGPGDLDDMFSKMDPFDCKLIKDRHKKDGRFPIPIIRIVFLLSGNGNSLEQHTYTPSKNCKPCFTSYDYVCSGVGADILLPTKGASLEWQQMVDKVDDWSSLYDVDDPDVLRSQLPASAKHEGHFTSWSDGVSLFEDSD